VATIVYQTDKRPGITYDYQSVSYRDKDLANVFPNMRSLLTCN